MKRSIVKHGPSTMTVSLPSGFVKKNNLKPGSEIEVEEKGNRLILNTEKQEETIKLSVDIKNNYKTGIRYINCSYRKGCDELLLYYDDSKYINRIEKCLSEEVLGFEIVKQGKENGKNYCVIKDIPGTKFDEFDTILERVWIIILSMSEDLIKAIESNDKSLINGINNLDKRINKFTNFCIRVLNKRSHPKYKNIPIYYRLLRGLEELADLYKFLANSFIINENNISKNELVLLKEIDESLKLFYKTYYKPHDEYIEKLLTDTKKRIDIFNNKVKTENVFYQGLSDINRKLRSLASIIIELNILN